MGVAQPSGTVTFLFTDIEGSTRVLRELGTDQYGVALADHCRLLREAFARWNGFEVDYEGDAFFIAFARADDAVSAAADAQNALAVHTWPDGAELRVRMGIHTGEPQLAPPKYVGMDVHRAARIAAAGHGGQILVSAATAGLVGGGRLTDLGEHRFKDLAAPEHVFQLGDNAFPPIRSLYRSNLPAPATAFLGRERELAEVTALVRQEGVRLVTLTGPGGTGKTRLALQVAAEAADSFPDGVWWVALAPLRDAALLLPAIGHVVEVTETPGRELIDTLRERLDGRRLLLLLDNAEHLLPGLASCVASLRDACPTVTLLVTSRERLRLAGEEVWPVPSLVEQEGVALFLARARSLRAEIEDSAAVTELCARLDQLPLALELAAARTIVFSPDQLLERLGQRLDLLKAGADADVRQQTLRATIDWSYQLLTADEQRVFHALSIFVGGCTYEAAEQIGGADPDMLQSLLDKSLLRRRETALGPRFWMLETIREYADEQLQASENGADVRRRFFDDITALADEVPFGFREKSWLSRVGAEHDNIRAALVVQPVTESHFRIASSLIDYWFWTGRVNEGRVLLERFLSTPIPASDATRARAECVAGYLAMLQDDLNEAERLFESSSTSLERIDMRPERALVSMCRGFISLHRGDLECAERHMTEALSITRSPDMEYISPRVLRALSVVSFRRGDVERGRVLQEESLAAARETDELVRDLILSDIAWRAVADGDFEKARQVAEDGLNSPQLATVRPDPALQHTLALALFGLERVSDADELARSALGEAWARNDVQCCSALVDLLGACAAHRGDDARAARLTGVAEQLLQRLGIADDELMFARAIYVSLLDTARSRAGGIWEHEVAVGKTLGVDLAVEFALAEGSGSPDRPPSP